MRRLAPGAELTVRADAGFFSWDLIDKPTENDTRFLVAVASNPAIERAVAAIGDRGWTPIGYTDDGEAQVAETTLISARRPNRKPARAVCRTRLVGDQAELWPSWQHHTFVTDISHDELDTKAADAANPTPPVDLGLGCSVMENPGAAGDEHDFAADRHRCERWFVRRGLPHLIHDYSASADVLTRAAPFLALVVFVEFFFVFGDRWTGWAQAAVFAVGLAVLTGVVALVNLLRGRRLWQLPDRFGVWEVLAYLVLGAVFAGLGSSDSVIVDAAFAAGLNAVLLIGAYVVTSWGLLPMVRWSVGQLWRQVGQVMTLLAKSLPILLVFSAFIFLNAEMWQVANDFTLPFFGMVALLLVAAGALFVIISVRRLAVDMARFSSWADVRSRCADTPIASLVPADDAPAPDSPPLGRRARFNVSLLLFVAQSIQIALVAVIVTCFYVFFGVFTVRESTLLQWTTLSQLTWEDSWVVSLPLWSGELLFSRQLVMVAAFIGLFSGLQFAVSVVLDSSYRSEFAEDMTDELREALAVRAVYHRTLVPETP